MMISNLLLFPRKVQDLYLLNPTIAIKSWKIDVESNYKKNKILKKKLIDLKLVKANSMNKNEALTMKSKRERSSLLKS